MKLSLIIVSFNTRELLKDCLTSVYSAYKRYIQKGKYEVLVVDNSSNDGTWTMLKREFPQVHSFKMKSNTGFAKANNYAVKKAKGDYILFLNPDTFVYAKTLPRLIEYLDNNPQVGIATCKVLLPNGHIDDASHRGFPTPWRALTHFLGLGRLVPFSLFLNGYHLGFRDTTKIHEIDACAGAFLFMRRDVGVKVKWFDEDYFWYGEDLDLCYKVKQEGFKIMYVPEVSIFHYKGASSGFKKHSQHLSNLDSKTKKRIRQSRFEVMKIFYKKHYQNRYPTWLTKLVFLGIDLKQSLS